MTAQNPGSRGGGRTPGRSAANDETTGRGMETSGDQTQDKGQGVVGQATEKAGELLDQATGRAEQLVDRATEQAKPRLEDQKERATETLRSAAHALRQTSQQLREQDQGNVAQVADWSAGRIERLSDYLRGRDVDDLLDEVENFARRQPLLFMTSAFGLGLLTARALRGSGRRGRRGGACHVPRPGRQR